MHAVEPLHSPTPEELMEYLDGEGTPAARDAITAHVAGCRTCQAHIAAHEELSSATRQWAVEAAPPSLRAPQLPAEPTSWFASLRQPRFAVVTLSSVAALAMLVVMLAPALTRSMMPAARVSTGSKSDETRTGGVAGGVVGGVVGGLPAAPPAAAAPAARPFDQLAETAIGQTAQRAPRTASVIKTATLHLIVKDFSRVRQTVEEIVAAANGFIDHVTVTGDSSVARQLRGTLRVPGDRLPGTLARLRAIGSVIEDTQGSEDVTDQIVDLEARLLSARTTEKRLTELLRDRTGKLSDVLDVERELARVRLDIERLDAQKTNIDRRVTYATIELFVAEERKAGLDSGPLSLGTRLRLGALDGIENLIESIAGALLLMLSAGPTLVFWGVLAGAAWVTWRAVRRRRGGSPA